MTIVRHWENDGEKNADGQYVATIHNTDTDEKQRFVGETHKEVADKLLEANAHNTAKIREFTGKQTPVLAQAVETPAARELSDDERFDIGQQLQNPATAASGVERLLEAGGTPVNKLRAVVDKDGQNELAERVTATGKEFASETPQYFICRYNSELMVNFMMAQGWDLAVKANYGIAFERLTASRLLVEKPLEQPQPSPAPVGGDASRLPAPTSQVRPRGVAYSSGLRASDSSASGPPKREPAKPKLTIEEVNAMPVAEYQSRITGEAGFKEAVDALYAPKQPVAATAR